MRDHILRTDLRGDPNIGLFGVATDDYLLIGNTLTEKETESLAEVLDVEVYRLNVAGTRLVGMFLAGNSNGIVAPEILTDKETERLEEIADDLGVGLAFLGADETALGNLILPNDNGCVVSGLLEDEKQEIEDVLDVGTGTAEIAGLETVGSCGVSTNQGLLVHRACSEEELDRIEEILDVRGNIGSVSYGSPFVGSGVLANSHGFAASGSTTGPELQRIDEALGFVDL